MVKIGCEFYKGLVKNDDDVINPLLIKLRDIGSFINPSKDVINICMIAEKTIREYESELLLKNM